MRYTEYLFQGFRLTRANFWLLGACAALAGGIVHLTRYFYNFPYAAAYTAWVVLFVTFLVIFVIKGRKPERTVVFVWSITSLLPLAFWYYFAKEFGRFDWQVVYFHIVAGLDDSAAVAAFIEMSKQTIFGFLLIAISISSLFCRVAHSRLADKVVAIVVLLVNPAVWGFPTFVLPSSEDTLANRYIVPDFERAKSGPRRNFVHVFLESTERTFYDENIFGDAMSPIKRLETNAFRATNMVQIANTDWSVAGMTAALCGVPLFPVGFIQGNLFSELPAFMPSARCLGDILSHDGYALTYVVGANPKFGGIDKLYLNHGFERVLGVQDIARNYPDAINDWGVNDSTVFNTALAIMRNMQERGAPYGIVLETVGGHHPDGFLSPQCASEKDKHKGRTGILEGIRCTNSLLQKFIRRADVEGLLANTVVVVQSDHLSMSRAFVKDFDGKKRRNLFFVLGSDVSVGEHTTLSSVMDIFPTVMEALGYQSQNQQAGLGVSLFSNEPTLTEQYGQNRINELIRKERVLGRRLWSYSGNDE